MHQNSWRSKVRVGDDQGMASDLLGELPTQIDWNHWVSIYTYNNFVVLNLQRINWQIASIKVSK
ncbi:hypothetical protein LguiB_024558 [Lonicera macranthoides]